MTARRMDARAIAALKSGCRPWSGGGGKKTRSRKAKATFPGGWWYKSTPREIDINTFLFDGDLRG